MGNRRAPYKLADLSRLLSAMAKAGIPIGKITHGPDGTLTIYPGNATREDSANPCDRLLD